jgi:hypothetical protein
MTDLEQLILNAADTPIVPWTSMAGTAAAVVTNIANALAEERPDRLFGLLVDHRRRALEETSPLSYPLPFTSVELGELRIAIKQRRAELADEISSDPAELNEIGRREQICQSLDTYLAEALIDIERRGHVA